MIKHALTYFHDSAHLFEQVQAMHWPILLDSGQAINPKTQCPGSQFGRYDILVAEPFITLVTQGLHTTITQGTQQTISEDDPFQLVKQYMQPYVAERNPLPFTGGALGYFGYDLARRIERLPSLAKDDMQLPEMMVGIYDWAVIVDHREKVTYLVSNQFHTNDEQWKALCALFEHATTKAQKSFEVLSDITSNLNQLEYQIAFNQVEQFITAGDCYQVNLAQRFSAKVTGDAWTCYLKLRALSPAPFMAYMHLSMNDRQIDILSASPERFLQLIDDKVETRPIKGTRKRFDDPQADLNSAIELLTSFKDRAENVMIVDLLRNDISKVCQVGSVKADQLFKLQSFANVHHLVSIVTGQLSENCTALDLLRSCFPGGSITGAPKLRAMEIIEALEPHRRGIYCGAIGYIGFDGDMDTNISIRTAVIADGYVHFYAGGGLVTDSTAEKEYKETLDKASNLISTMQYFMRN